MDMDKLTQQEIDRILALSDAFGPSGMEDEVSALVQKELAGVLELTEDRLRNVRGELNPDNPGPRIMLDAHLDEVGLIVQAVKPDGTMRFLPLGGMTAGNLPSSLFELRASDGRLVKASVAAKPPHFMSAAERNALQSIDDMVLDCGSVSAAETKDYFGLGVGTFGVPSVKSFYEPGKGLFFGKAYDCRIGVAAEIETLRRLKGKDLPCRVQASFAVQEEVGERGVYANYKALRPDLMICFEGCPADDTFQEPYLVQAALYRGPMLRHFDRSMITSPRFQKFALELGRANGIALQESVRSGGGTDGGRIHTEDVPCIVVGIPVRYIHSHYGWCTANDYRAAVELAVKICQTVDDTVLASF